MQIAPLDDKNQPEALAYLRRLPYRNAMLLSNVTQLRRQCAVLLACGANGVLGVATHYRALPFLNLIFAVEHADLLPPLLEAMAQAVPSLHGGTIIGVLPEMRAAQLMPYVQVEWLEYELQMVVEPETLRERPGADVRRLAAGDLPALGELAQQAGLTAFSQSALDNGPAFGTFAEGQLVAMALTRFATPEVIEIGNIATHPDHRRRGYAAACTAALARACFSLAPRVYLMVLEQNTPALAAYRSLGFMPLERFAIMGYKL